jgi:peptidoglycan/LPS O-acetylase OafA/YrhL
MISGIMLGIGFLSWAIISFTLYACYVAIFSFTFWMAIDAGKADRFLWIVIIVGVPIIGPATYFFVEKKREYKRITKMTTHE